MDSLLLDLRHGVRTLAATPGVTADVVVILAVAIGANTALFSAVHGVVLSALPFPDSDRLMSVWSANEEQPGQWGTSIPDYFDWAERTRAFSELAALGPMWLNVSGFGEPLHMRGYGVSSNYFDTFRCPIMLGRAFRPEENEPGGQPVAILAHSAWKSHFGADPDIVGRSLVCDGEAHTIVGVADPRMGFRQAFSAQVYVPLKRDGGDRGQRFLWVFGRLAPGVAADEAAGELRTITAALEQDYPDTNAGWSITQLQLQEQLYKGVRLVVLVLYGAAAFVLLVACANVASLLLTRSEGRRHELATRAALGARLPRLTVQLLLETGLLVLAGGALGVVLAGWTTGALGTALATVAAAGGEYGPIAIRLDGAVLAFSCVVCALTTFACTIPSALRAVRLDLRSELIESGVRSTRGRDSRRGLDLLLALEVAVAVVLLVGAGLLVRSYRQLLQVEPGFDPERLLAVQVELPQVAEYARGAERQEFAAAVLERIRAVPGVSAATVALSHPMSGNNWANGFELPGRSSPPGRALSAEWRTVGQSYFGAMGIPILAGRGFTAVDDGSHRVVVVNQEFVRRFLPEVDPLGVQVRVHDRDLEIVGVAADIAFRGLAARERAAFMYEPIEQASWLTFSFMVRTANDPSLVIEPVRNAIWSVAPEQSISRIQMMDGLVADSIALQRVGAALVATMAGVALFVTVVGLYGVLSYVVSRRSHEIGIRRALGATAAQVLVLVMRRGMAIVAVGVAAGLGGAVALSRVVVSLLYGIEPTDPLIYATVGAGVLLVAGVMCLWSARRSALVEPTTALREG